MQKGQLFLQGLTDTDFLGPTLMPILGSKKIAISDSLANIKKIYIISSVCGYQILVTKICGGGRTSDI